MQTTEICVALWVYPDGSVRYWMVGKEEETGKLTPISISEENAFNHAHSPVDLQPEREADSLSLRGLSSWGK